MDGVCDGGEFLFDDTKLFKDETMKTHGYIFTTKRPNTIQFYSINNKDYLIV